MSLDTKKVLASSVIGALAIGAGVSSAVDSSDFTQAQVDALVLEAGNKSFALGAASVVPTVVESIKEVKVPVEVIKEVIVVKEVGSEELAELEQALMDNDGNVSFCTQELDDNEVALVSDCIVLTNDFKALALAEVKSELADLVDREVVSNVTLDEDDVERIRLNDDLEEVEVANLDFEDKDADVTVSGTFEHEDVKYEFEVKVEIKDGKVDDVSLESVDLA